MFINRRDFLLFLAAGLGTVACESLRTATTSVSATSNAAGVVGNKGFRFQPVRVPLPLKVENLSTAEQMETYKTYEVVDDLVVPVGFTYDVIAAWGDRVGDSRFGYNNDYLSLIETAPNEGYLTVNFEYISGKTWMQTYPLVIEKSLPFTEVIAAAAKTESAINAFALPENDPLKAKIEAIAKAGLIDQGIGIIAIRRNAEGRWERTNSPADRRITGISGLEDDRTLKATGPAVAIFTKPEKLGYEDGLGDRIIGTFQNCAGGTTPWGTVLSAEENFQSQVPEPVMADGSSLDPAQMPFVINEYVVDGRANVFGLAGNKYGWIVEVDPANPQDYGTKHTWLGRFRHEAVGIRAVAGKKLALYSGCDRRGGHIYKFVSQDSIIDPTDKANSRLLEQGMLYGAQFNADGSGRWIALTPETPVDPVRPSQVLGAMVTLPNPDRAVGGVVTVTSDEEIATYQQQFKTLGDLYPGTKAEKQGAIAIDAHYAASAAGVSCTARPEDTIIASDGTLYIAFTSGSPGGDGGPDKAVFQGSNGETPYEYGWIVSLQESQSDPAAMTFQWEAVGVGGEPAEGGMGFANPDNLEIDKNGDLWMVTDISTGSHNQAVPPGRTEEGKPLNQKELRGIFGNNSVWFIPTSGDNAGQAYPFAIAPMDCETCGPFFTADGQSLFVALQHPGEAGGIRQNMAAETRQYAMRTTDGQEFLQKRQVPIGSNWPGKESKDPPKPAVVVIYPIAESSL